MRKLATAELANLGFKVDPTAPVGTLSVAQRQMVDIARAVSRKARIVVLDEPSAVLGDNELADLFALIRRLSKTRGFRSYTSRIASRNSMRSAIT